MSFTKGQEISVGNCGVFNSPKKPMKKIMGGKVVYRGVQAKHCWVLSTTFENKKFVDNVQQCFAFTPQANFPTQNLNFH